MSSANVESRVKFNEQSYNGMLFNDIPIPEELISRLFVYYVDPNSLLNCQLVCKQWNMIITDYVWRQKAAISTHHHFVADDPYDWKEYYIVHTKSDKNLVKNHSGAKNRNNWIIERNGGEGWVIERPPSGTPHLPEEPDFEKGQHCFVTSYDTCEKRQTINLINEGFSDKMLDNLQPTIEVLWIILNIKFSQWRKISFYVCSNQVSEWYSCRFDCPANYNLTVRLYNSNNEILDTFKFSDTLSDERQNVWHKVNCVKYTYYRPVQFFTFSWC